MKGKLLGARVLIKEDKRESNKQGGVVVPGSEKEPTYKGKVIAVGNGALTDNGTRIPVDIPEGATILYTAFAGAPVQIDKETYLILNDRDVLFVFED